MFRGYWATFWRDVPSWGLYFWFYEWLKVKGESLDKENWSERKLKAFNILWLMNAGGLAGIVSSFGS